MTIEKLKSILESNAFDQLSSYRDPLVWNAMTHDERELLGILFVKSGEHQLLQGDNTVLESFALAAKISPNSPKIFFKKAVAFAAQGQNIRCLEAAGAALEKATQLDPLFMSAWHSWGNVLVRIGVFYEDHSYFQKADEMFAKVESIAKDLGTKVTENLYWHWGICWFHLGKHSGEAVDYFCSMAKFRLEEEHATSGGEFYNDYGNVLIDLACLIGREELFIEAVEHYEKATLLAPVNYEGWLNLACTYQRLYNFSGSRDYFYKAEECFERAIEINPQDPVIWLRWAELDVAAGKVSRDLERLHMSFEKFQQSDVLESGNPFVMLRWCEAQIITASLSENLELLREAQHKITQVLKAIPHHQEVWHIYGLCLNEFGRYFGCEEHYFQAIQKYQHGLEINEENPMILYGMAMTYLAIGDLKNSAEFIEKSISCFMKASAFSKSITPPFLNDWGIALMRLGEMTNERAHIESAAMKFEQAINGHLGTNEGEEIELEWLYNYGCSMDFLGDFHDEPIYYEKAVQVLSHVLKLDPDYVYARYNLALALSHLGELNCDVECFYKAIDQFSEVIQFDAEDDITWNDFGLAMLNLAVLTSDPVDSNKAQSCFNQAEVQLQHAASLGSQQAFYNLACLYSLTGKISEAIFYLEKAEHSNALPPADDVIHDEWLDGLRDQPAYRQLISRLLNLEE
jgi:tetratricopeptide (TPR) repeat protein